ncbi:MAG TPA: hypothetical protein VFT41_01525 [Gemmatimonadaceae bacterium]|nr:hypothetical protein [Gemmatimonadaceae bacterium]
MGRARRRTDRDELEISIGPHSAREGWAVLRVTFPKLPEHQDRIDRALRVLYGALDEERETVREREAVECRN